jgi:thiamine kinase-like enzyme
VVDNTVPPPPPGLLDRLELVLTEVESLAGTPRDVSPLVGGLTNFNFKVVTPARTAVVRLSSTDGDLLAIDRDAENLNSRRAWQAGAAPAVLDYLPHRQALVVAWVEGHTLASDDLHDETMLRRVAEVVRTLHAGPRFVTDFDMAEVQRRYLAIVQERGFRMPDGYLDLLPEADRITKALAAHAEPTVPCNNDLLAANLIDDGDRLWVIDYEYAGNNDPCFELGNLSSESDLTVDELTVLVDAYYGRHVAHAVARAQLYALLARYGWTLWASIQDAVSSIDFDFWSWGMEKYDRAREDFASPAYERLLAEAQRPD